MKNLLKIAVNKFVLTGILFVVWMSFFDQNNWSAQEERNRELRETERHISYLNEQIERMEKEYRELTRNPRRLEQYARERYKMKRDNEDLYIFED